MKLAGLLRNAAYLIRPDGYIGLAEPNQDPVVLAGYLEKRDIRPANLAKARTDAARALRAESDAR